MAKLGIVLGDWMAANDLAADARCNVDLDPGELWRERLHADEHDEQDLMPSACEVDITGVVSMYALQLASGRRPRWWIGTTTMPTTRTSVSSSTAATGPRASYRASRSAPPILGSTLGLENTYGAIAGRVPAGPIPSPASAPMIVTGDPHLRGRGRIHRRSARHLRQPGGRARAGPAGADALRLQERL